MDRGHWLIGLVLAAPPAVGVVSAIHLSAPRELPIAIASGVVTFIAIMGLVWLSVEYNPPLPDDDRYDVPDDVAEEGGAADDGD